MDGPDHCIQQGPCSQPSASSTAPYPHSVSFPEVRNSQVLPFSPSITTIEYNVFFSPPPDLPEAQSSAPPLGAGALMDHVRRENSKVNPASEGGLDQDFFKLKLKLKLKAFHPTHDMRHKSQVTRLPPQNSNPPKPTLHFSYPKISKISKIHQKCKCVIKK